MDRVELEAIAQHWIDAFNSHEVENILALYHERAAHFSPGYRKKHPESYGVLETQEQMRKWWQYSFDTLPNLTYTLQRVESNGPVVTMFYNRHVDGQEDRIVEESLKIRNGKIVASAVIPSA